MNLSLFVKNVYIILLSPAYKNITFFVSSQNSHEMVVNNVDNFVQRQFALLNISNIQIYIYIFNLYILLQRGWGGGGGVVELLLCYFFLGGGGGLTPLKFGKLCSRGTYR